MQLNLVSYIAQPIVDISPIQHSFELRPISPHMILLGVILIAVTFIIIFFPLRFIYYRILGKIYRSNFTTSILLMIIPLSFTLILPRVFKMIIPIGFLSQAATSGIEIAIFYLGFTNLQYASTKVFGLRNWSTAHRFHQAFLSTNNLHPFDGMWKYSDKVTTHVMRLASYTPLDAQFRLHEINLDKDYLNAYFKQVGIDQKNYTLIYQIKTYLKILYLNKVKAYLLNLENLHMDKDTKLNSVQFFTKGRIAFLVYVPKELPLELVEDVVQQIFTSPTGKPIKEVRILYPTQISYKLINQ